MWCVQGRGRGQYSVERMPVPAERRVRLIYNTDHVVYAGTREGAALCRADASACGEKGESNLEHRPCSVCGDKGGGSTLKSGCQCLRREG